MIHDITTLFENLPGADLMIAGLDDVAAGRETVAGELVKIGSPRLRESGVNVDVSLDADRQLYRLLSASHGLAAHSQYNALVRQLVSFERALAQRIARESRLSPG